MPSLCVIKHGLVHLAHDLLLIELDDLDCKHLPLLGCMNGVPPGVKLSADAPRGQLLPGTDQHIVTVLFRFSSRLHGQEGSLRQVLEVRLLANLNHVVLQAPNVHSLRQSVDDLVHEDKLSICSLSVADFTGANHALEVDLA